MDIIIRNLQDGDKLPHQLALLEGQISSSTGADGGCKGQLDVSHNCQFTSCIDHETEEANLRWPVRNGRFKAIVPLHQGRNEISLKFEQCIKFVVLFYKPKDTDGHFIRPLYLICNDDQYDGRFQGPEEPGQRGAKVAFQKIDLGMKLFQLFVGESLHRHGLKRRTVRFDTEEGLPLCKLFRLTTVTTAEASKLSDQKMWHLVKDELAMDTTLTHDKTRSKYMAFVSFTRYANPLKLMPETHEEKLALTKGHCALGGGGLALLSTGCLHTWATKLSELVARFTDCREVDRMTLLDDSRLRKTYWGCYAATLGAAFHELGHTFDLCHNEEGLMSGKLGEVHKSFILPELLQECETANVECADQSKIEDEPETSSLNLEDLMSNGVSAISLVNQIKLKKHLGNDWDAADFRRPEALWLFYHKWLNRRHKNDSGEGPQVNGCFVRVRHGVRIVMLAGCVNKDFITRRYYEFPNGTRQLTTKLGDEDLRQLMKEGEVIRIMVADSYGNALTHVGTCRKPRKPSG